MFGFFDSVEKKARTNAAGWLELADKVYSYRHDVLPAALRADLLAQTQAVRDLLREKADASRLKLGVENLEQVLARAGGTHYPRSSWTENVEFFLVAAIVIIGVRTYFVQPFKIPTNSMWPSYNGMTPEVFATPADEPTPWQEAGRLLTNLARPWRVDAPDSGEVLLPVATGPSRGLIKYASVAGRSWGLFSAQLREYHIRVGDHEAVFRVPWDFDFDWVVKDTFFGHEPGAESARLDEMVRPSQLLDLMVDDGRGGRERVRYLKTGRIVKAGDRILSFDIMTGDQLFVDRISYNFVQPSVGDGFVFRTGNIHSPYMIDENGRQINDYYIKRLVGRPGDTLEIREHALYRNGAPITGSAAFDKNARQVDHYPGYRAAGSLAPGETMTVPADGYLAFGDNSANSQDGRYWGFVPAKDVVGRPIFIYYPFTHRWGVAP